MWKNIDWEASDCALIRQFIQPEVDQSFLGKKVTVLIAIILAFQ